MGCGRSSLFGLTPDEKLDCAAHVEKHLQKTLNALGVPVADVQEMYRIFTRVDHDASLTIEINELIKYFKVTESLFTCRVFSAFDLVADGRVDFSEFFIGFFNYCTLTHDELVQFTFEMFDVDKSGDIDKDELKELVVLVSGDHGLDHNTTALLKKMDDDHNGTVDLGEFRRMEHNANTLLQPCYIIQERMISELGATFWARQRKRRKKAMVAEGGEEEERRRRSSTGEYSSMMDIVNLHKGMYGIEDKEDLKARRERRKDRERRKQRLAEAVGGNGRRLSTRRGSSQQSAHHPSAIDQRNRRASSAEPGLMVKKQQPQDRNKRQSSAGSGSGSGSGRKPGKKMSIGRALARGMGKRGSSGAVLPLCDDPRHISHGQ